MVLFVLFDSEKVFVQVALEDIGSLTRSNLFPSEEVEGEYLLLLLFFFLFLVGGLVVVLGEG